MNAVVKMNQAAGDVMESVIAKGDLAKLTPEERTRYYSEVCRSMGLNPLTQPFSYITLNGKLALYATRTCADQLRKINGVSLEIVSRQVDDGIMTVHVRAKLPDGRCDEDYGSVAFPDTVKGEARANAELKCVTKAKRRATLSICGLGWLDETEVEDIPASAKRPAPVAIAPPHDPQTGEVIETINEFQIAQLQELIVHVGADIPKFCKYLGVSSINDLPTNKFEHAKAALNAKAQRE